MTYRDVSHYYGIEKRLQNRDLTPILIVLGGGTSYGTYNERSDVDIWGHHLESEPEFVNIFSDERESILTEYDLDPKKPFQFSSESISKTMGYIRGDVNNSVTGRIWRIENFLFHPRIFSSPEIEPYVNETRSMIGPELVDLYQQAARETIKKVSTITNDKTALTFIRFVLTAHHLKMTDELIIDVPTLVETYGLSIDWNSVRTTDNRWRDEEYWSIIISQGVDILNIVD